MVGGHNKRLWHGCDSLLTHCKAGVSTTSPNDFWVKKTLKICCFTLQLRSRSELQSIDVGVYFTSQKFVACLRFIAKVCGMVESHGKFRGVIRGHGKSLWHGEGMENIHRNV